MSKDILKQIIELTEIATRNRIKRFEIIKNFYNLLLLFLIGIFGFIFINELRVYSIALGFSIYALIVFIFNLIEIRSFHKVETEANKTLIDLIKNVCNSSDFKE